MCPVNIKHLIDMVAHLVPLELVISPALYPLPGEPRLLKVLARLIHWYTAYPALNHVEAWVIESTAWLGSLFPMDGIVLISWYRCEGETLAPKSRSVRESVCYVLLMHQETLPIRRLSPMLKLRFRE